MLLESRRRFLQAVAAAPLMGAARPVAPAATRRERDETSRPVVLSGDGLSLSPADYVQVLEGIVERRGIAADNYSLGGVVEELERTLASALGKERAIYLPTGTLANHMAVRTLARDRSRVIVPDTSHLYNDSGDCAERLSQLNLVPLAPDRATFTRDEVRSVVERTSTGRVRTGVGALVIESPVRRKRGEIFDFGEMRRISAYARENDIRTHLDGARLYMASAYTGISPREYASHFDTVYVSLWKYFNCGSGAILAGPGDVIEGLFHMRRMFGGGLPEVWQYAAVALHYFEDFEAEFARAVRTASSFFALAKEHPAFDIEPVPRGSNIFGLRVRGTDLYRFRERSASNGVLLPAPRPDQSGFLVTVNATWNRTDPEALVRKLVASL
ncbi:MAG TPA: beta-eliminating lyase-related protein [Vicinamibacteria bacterium]|nr:beta-eliminating lyase-related protein [Vicinamibacteria bacterium]